MADEDLRRVIEDNFRLMSLTLRETGTMFRQDLTGLKEELDRRIDELSTGVDGRLDAVADRLDQTLEAIKTLAFADVEHRQKVTDLEKRVEQLESWRAEQEAS